MHEAEIILGCTKEGAHWTVVVIDVKAKSLMYFNSLSYSDKATPKTKGFIKNWRLFAREYNKMVSEEESKLVETLKFACIEPHAIQGSDSTCGIYCLLVISFLLFILLFIFFIFIANL